MTAPHDERPSSLLDPDEIALLSRALYEWGGPAHASDLVGSGTDWRTTTGMDDDETIRLLRTIQRKLGPVVRPYYGTTPGTPS